jgi:hypothetical protein
MKVMIFFVRSHIKKYNDNNFFKLPSSPFKNASMHFLLKSLRYTVIFELYEFTSKKMKKIAIKMFLYNMFSVG